LTSPSAIILLVLLAALLHASWNALVKIGGDRKLTTAMVAIMSGVVCLPLLPFVDPPDQASWPFILGSVAIHLGYYYGLSEMYETGDFSLVYPLARGPAPLLVALAAAATAGEALGGWKMLGVVMVSLGIASLAFGRGWPRGDHARAVIFAGFTCLTIAAYSLVDGFGVRHAGSSLGYIAWLFVIDAIPFPLIIALHRGRTLAGYIRRNWKTGLGAAAMSASAYGIVIWAMDHTAMAGVVSLRETSVVFAAAIGALFMGESFGPWRICAAIAVTLGNVLIHL